MTAKKICAATVSALMAVAAVPSMAPAAPPATPIPAAAAGGPRWYKGNLHTHSLWSDGDDFPERIAAWYRDHGYDFLGISDHNTLQAGEKWLRFAQLKTKGVGPATEKYLKEFPKLARTRGDVDKESYEVRLTPFAEYRKAFEKPGEFLLIPGEEVTDKFEKKPVHMGGVNLAGDPVKPLGGKSVVEVIRNNCRAIQAAGVRANRPVLPHLNHPNFGWGVTAEEMAVVTEERYFEVFNGHPTVHNEGDETRPDTGRMWDIANALRLTALNAPPMYGLGTDDGHSYHVPGMGRATPGRGWVCVRATELSADALIAAMNAGDFYASSGVVLADVRYDSPAGTLTVEVEPEAGETYLISFVGSLAPAAGVKPAEAAPVAGKPGAAASKDVKDAEGDGPDGKVAKPDPAGVGVALADVVGTRATYKLTGRELYVRAVVTADQPPDNPSGPAQMKQAWTQPVGWEKWVRE
jgi:hypothetical protein